MATWEEIFITELVGRDFKHVISVGTGREVVFRGLIKRAWVDEADWGGLMGYVEATWVAMRKSAEDPWVWCRDRGEGTTFGIHIGSSIHRDGAVYDEHGRPTARGSRLGIFGNYGGQFTLMPVGANLDKAEVLTEYHVRTHVRHSLYPPYPFRDLQGVGIVQNVLPERPISQDQVEVTAVTFVVPAHTLRAAKAFCMRQCRGAGLPVLSMTRIQLRPGY